MIPVADLFVGIETAIAHHLVAGTSSLISTKNISGTCVIPQRGAGLMTVGKPLRPVDSVDKPLREGPGALMLARNRYPSEFGKPNELLRFNFYC